MPPWDRKFQGPATMPSRRPYLRTSNPNLGTCPKVINKS
jgi:hypothetical protein